VVARMPLLRPAQRHSANATSLCWVVAAFYILLMGQAVAAEKSLFTAAGSPSCEGQQQRPSARVKVVAKKKSVVVGAGSVGN
jgi:hypothetical protein